MLKWALIFAVIGLAAGALGFGGIAGGAFGLAKFLSWAASIIAVGLVVLGGTIFKQVTCGRRPHATRGSSGFRAAVMPAARRLRRQYAPVFAQGRRNVASPHHPDPFPDRGTARGPRQCGTAPAGGSGGARLQDHFHRGG